MTVMKEVHIDSVGIFDEVEEHDDCTVQILRSSVTGEISVGWRENRRSGCRWCRPSKRSKKWEDLMEHERNRGARYCGFCGRKYDWV